MRRSKITALLFAALVMGLSTACTHESLPSDSSESAPAVQEKTEPAAAEGAFAPALTAEKETDLDLTKLTEFDLSSEDLHDGVWDTDITKTKNGSNRSPQLSWQPVEGASCYAVYMIDTGSTGYSSWMHWKSLTGSETELPKGWAPESEYVGPYPPEGTHVYEVLVFALKQAPDSLKGNFDNSNDSKLLEFLKYMDGENGGNIISYGHIRGTYTYGD